MKLFLVGGAVRDHLLGLPSADFDFAVEADSYEAMRDGLLTRGLKVWQERPEFVTIRGQISLSNLGTFGGLLPVGSYGAFNADFTLCRVEGPYSDLRHPDAVTPGSLADDLKRRDFTVNAVAISEDGPWFDPHEGTLDARTKLLRAVGSAQNRIEEDPLRMLRAVRFAVRYGMKMESTLLDAVRDSSNTDLLASLPNERVREELNKALTVNWHATMYYLMVECPNLGWSLSKHHPRLWMKAMTEEK